MKHTPLIEQYLKIKNQYKDYIVFFQVGDFFEMFMEDAFLVNQLLGLTLTKKNNVPMCGIPISTKDIYVNKLIDLNKKIVLCEQTAGSNDKIINRTIKTIVTPGTNLNMDKDHSYLLAVTEQNNQFSIHYVDFSTQECYAQIIEKTHLNNKILQISPKEIIIPKNIDINLFKPYENILSVIDIHENDTMNLIKFYLSVNKQEFNHNLRVVQEQEYMYMCSNTLKNLNLVDKSNSLLSTINFTQTPMGYRFLKNTLLYPLINLQLILQRQSILEKFIEIYKTQLFIKIKIQDIRKMLSNLKTIKDLKNIAINIDLAINLIKKIGNIFLVRLEKLGDITINTIIHHNINDDYEYTCKSIEILKKKESQLYQKMSEYTSHRIKRNNLIGFFMELKKNQKPQEDFILKQGMVNCNRYTSQELLKIEAEIIEIEEQIIKEETTNFQWLKDQIIQETNTIHEICDIIGEIDYFYSCAQSVCKYSYFKPHITKNPYSINIKEAYHPIVANKMRFIPNDFIVNNDNFMFLITGPNMGGKSTYLKTNAIMVIMAQCGMFIPAKATISIIEKIFMRVGASDNLIEGKSTFMLEMLDCANILNNANEKSLILIDELGRGTSTTDGMSISIAIIEHIHNHIKAITLIATHYNELSKCAEYLDNLSNLKTSIKESLLLYKIIPGVSDGSFGIFAAQKAGLSNNIITRARELEKQINLKVTF